MANRHKAYAKGGGVAPKKDADKTEYNGQGSKLMKEAHEKKSGGKVDGKKGKHRLDKKARGGSVKASGHDMTKSPFSAAHVKPQVDGGNPHPHHLKHKGEHGAKG